MSLYFQAKAWARHWLHAVDEHSIHSPFFFDFYQQVVRPKDEDSNVFADLETLRSRLLRDTHVLPIHDLGAASSFFSTSQRTVQQIARTSLARPKWARFYYRLSRFIHASSILELGSSLGVTTLYLARAGGHVTTFEGQPELVRLAREHYLSVGTDITLVEGTIDSTLPQFLQQPQKIDLVLMDANHRYAPTLKYFALLTKRMHPKGIIILDDLYHSEEMTKAWHELQQHPLVYGSIDLFRCGILFFDPALNRQHYIWRL